ncbi:MAG: dTDP-glucose 4,6-dehydratase [Cytophagia bacterium]|nr:dTDP-glucose 4,6-dehydratase [Cytophagia bacterium]
MNFNINKYQERFSRILVTGGAGFIGSCLIRKLLQTTNCRIFNLDKLSYSSDQSSINNTIKDFCIETERYQHFKIDLINYEDVKKVLDHSNPDIIFHLAAESHVDRSIDNPKPFIKNNIIGTLNLLDNANKYFQKLDQSKSNKFRFINISTDEVFGSIQSGGFFNEVSQYNPTSPYSASKASCDHLVNAWFHTYGLPVITTNCSNNFGPWQFPEKLIPLTINKALSEQKIPIYGDGKNIRDWLFVEDHVEALLKISFSGKLGQKYCIGGYKEITNLEIVENICEKLDVIRPINYSYKDLINFVKDRPGHDFRYAVDSSKIENEIMWKINNSFKQALEDTIIWYLNNQTWCKKVLNKSGYLGERIGLMDNS